MRKIVIFICLKAIEILLIVFLPYLIGRLVFWEEPIWVRWSGGAALILLGLCGIVVTSLLCAGNWALAKRLNTYFKRRS